LFEAAALVEEAGVGEGDQDEEAVAARDAPEGPDERRDNHADKEELNPVFHSDRGLGCGERLIM